MRNLEQELKLSLSQREYRVLKEFAKAEPKLQTNFYFTSQLMPADEMARVRVKGDKRILCYKKRLTDRGGVLVADEREREIDEKTANRFISRGITQVEMLELLSAHMADDLRCVGSMDTWRLTFKLEEWTIDLDKNDYLGITDYELECESNSIESLEKLKSYLPYAFGVTLKPSCPKVQRFMRKLKKPTDN